MGFLKGLCWGREANCQGSQEDGVAWNDGVVPPHCFQHYNLYHSWLSRSCNKGRKWRKPKLFTARGGRNNSHNKWHQITPCWGNCNFQAWPLAHLILSCHRAFMCSLINYQLLTLICCTTINYTKAFIFLPTLKSYKIVPKIDKVFPKYARNSWAHFSTHSSLIYYHCSKSSHIRTKPQE